MPNDDSPMQNTLRLDPAISVNEILRLFPAALPALNAAGIDTCCGGAEPLATAAHDAGANLDALIERISAHAAGAAR
jgi:iron-sulfur cluster repair protein YtfE (RIC family)